MAEDLTLAKGTKEEQYEILLPQIKALISGETDTIANLANICAALKEQFNWFWIGFYLVKQEELIVGPFQGPIACTRIAKGRGVCGKAWQEERTLIVEDVNTFNDHIACNSNSKSEIVLPLVVKGKVIGVLDIDHNKTEAFDTSDQKYLEELLQIIAEHMENITT